MNRTALSEAIKSKRTFLCVGLDTDAERIPKFLLDQKDPVTEFNRRIIEATKDHCIAYKINTAFYESNGIAGWRSLEQTLKLLPDNVFKIADAKRGDIGNTSKQYAKTFFETFEFDAITVSPYMGRDSVEPFFEYAGKWVIILGLTSNTGANDFEMQKLSTGKFLYEEVIGKSSEWGNAENTMYVTGATRSEKIAEIRKLIPEHFLLVPGVGAQGGDLKQTIEAGKNEAGGLLINSSREIIYADNSTAFDEAARKKAASISEIMAQMIN